ncbi:hypothetical protein [Actinomarinicola tropica]|uniref:Uncharacterized protein n=1 Tax=Actinomarinicola tropica TaxID=2789776 RepID=A0A5Q2RNQ8_9ACTN|nr:hypothetical protein [Actinomarinicola tropica]QGG96221.1 hypothetical protein GH723_14535 [Actinomarinicola tropica]
MDGIVVLLALCLGGALVAALAVAVVLSRDEHERAGYYGSDAQRRRHEADLDAATVAAIVERSDRDELAHLVDRLDRLAWDGTPMASARPVGRTGVWVLTFTGGAEVQVHARDGRILRRAAALARREPLVVSEVRVAADAVVVQLRTPYHAPLAVTLTV